MNARHARQARGIASRVAVVLAAVAASVLAWRSGGGAEGAATPPRPDEPVSDGGPVATSSAAAASATDAAPRAPSPSTTPEGYEVALRLVDLMKDARVEAPNAAQGQHFLGLHWRKMRPAWSPINGPNARFVTSIALRVSATEKQWSIDTGGGKAWTPDAKIWNMNEGSYEQRDAIVAAPPQSVALRVAVPQGARLTFAEGTINTARDATLFSITVTDAKGEAREVYRHRLPPARSRRWTEASCGLEAYAGQSVEIRLATEVATATAEERREAVREREAARKAEKKERSGTGTGTGTGTYESESASDTSDAGALKEDALESAGVGIGLWGSPTVVAKGVPRLPFNVLWIVVDALRPDVIASFHDDGEDAEKMRAASPPLEALLPRVKGLTPAIDELAARGVRFTHAYSAGSWTRPGTLAMLSGARSSELGIDTQSWVLQPAAVQRLYASEPPLLPLLARRLGASTHAFVNNYFMVGYAPVGVEMGFEHVADHRYRTRDTLEITRDAAGWLRHNKDTRFFLFVNYNSPHEPYEPPAHLLERVPPPPAGPEDKIARLYMAEAAKDDEAIGVLMSTLDETRLRENTIIVVTADHGETMSSAHKGISGLDRMPIRYHHAVSNYEETTRVPILIVAPGMLPMDRAVKERVRNVDIAPTVAELLGLEAHPRFSGRSLVALAKGGKEKDERVVVTEGRGTRAIMHGRYRLLVREGPARTTILPDRTINVAEELFDLVDDPGERNDLARARPDLVAEMRARLDAALKNVPVAGSAAALAGDDPKPPMIHLRFAGGGAARRVSGAITIGDARARASTFTLLPIELGRDSLRINGSRAEIAFTTTSATAVGFDIVVEPPGTPVSWDLYLDDKAWPDDAVFGGPYGLAAPLLRRGLVSDDARAAAQSPLLPPIDPRRDLGLFIVRERRGDALDAPPDDEEGAEEMARLLKEWGYAHGSGTTR